jgi:hypothetical protein
MGQSGVRLQGAWVKEEAIEVLRGHPVQQYRGGAYMRGTGE